MEFSEWSFYTDFSRIVNILLGNINYSNIIIESLSFNVIDKP